MLLLITDTSGRNGFVALVRAREGEENKIQVIEKVALAGGTFSAQLVPQVAGLISKHGFAKTDIAAFIVASGPGSFTGLRVGLAAVKALAEILHKPIVPVSLLEVVAAASGTRGKVLAVLDAGRGEIYVGQYEVDGDSARMIEERLLGKNEFLPLAPGAETVSPDENLIATLRANGVSARKVDAVEAAEFGRLGWQKLRDGLVVSPEQLEANYIRRSDAEIFAKPAVRPSSSVRAKNDLRFDLPTRIRPATADDILPMLALEEHCSTAAHWTKQQYQLSIQSSDEAFRRLVLVAQPAPSSETSSADILGFLVARRLGSEWELENIVVSEMFQREGIGRRLVEELLSRARETGGNALFLEVRESNTPARSLYEQAGFQPTGRRKSYYQDPQEDGILYRRNLR
jgi:tRNA threonylcarbamoyladenosine biosynthesis protein TsaB